ncbi:MAG: acetolactate synthase large subunit [Actinomycetota bacterium]|jgi:acetolactate synthase-1/2/3 large subunit|nr:acetolactate synthase large subunit [Actinomycetota bacterium]
MNGARALLETLVGHGVDTCFMNPGTSEMHFVAALDDVAKMRSVLCLFEGVATGAADGFARMSSRPAAVLLHLGPGLGNGLANLHNARRARSPVVAIVGDHATVHWKYDAQLQSDIETVARNVSAFVRTSHATEALGADAAAAIAAAEGPPGSVATLILPADVSWSEGASPAPRPPVAPTPPATDDAQLDAAAAALRGGSPCGVLVGGRACSGKTLELAAAIAAATGAKLFAETFPARLERGAGRPPVERLGYLAEFTAMQLEGTAHLLLVDAKSPVSFFAYPGRPSDLVPEGCQVHTVAGLDDDVDTALVALAELVGASPVHTPRQQAGTPGMPSGALDAAAVAAVLGALLPEGAIVSDEGNTSGLFVAGATAGSPPHDWLCLTGGAIGQGLPVALGAAVACPDRRVVALEADGSSLYTPQAWWSMARAGCDVTTVLLNNGSYAVLNMELDRVGAEPPGPRAKDMLDLGRPDLDFVSLARGMGVPAERATTVEELTTALARSFATPGPSVVEVLVPSIL